ncbi:MAG: hypothetical protein AABX02_00355 [archaeon]
MGYYTDLFLRPKQAVAYAYAHPSLVRSIGFVILGTLLGAVGSFLLVGEITPSVVIAGLSGDLARWLLGGIILLLIGLAFKGLSFSGENVSRVLTLLAQLNLYGFFVFLIMGIIFPVLVIPEILVASGQANSGVIGPEEFQQVVYATLAQPNVTILAAFLFLISFVFVLYSIYVLFLSIQKYLDTTVFKSILVMILLLGVQSFFTFILLG